MGDRTQRLKGKANEAAGKTKGAVGYETRSGKTEAKGARRLRRARRRGLSVRRAAPRRRRRGETR